MELSKSTQSVYCTVSVVIICTSQHCGSVSCQRVCGLWCECSCSFLSALYLLIDPQYAWQGKFTLVARKSLACGEKTALILAKQGHICPYPGTGACNAQSVVLRFCPFGVTH
uniref:Uncharacterized protein n=1 Tax=Anguilla anguilla TaxID=7936 RepID=A0A0E9X5B6_ANGAN